MVLHADHEVLRGEIGARGAARAAEVFRLLALEREALGERARQRRRRREVDVVPAALAGEPHVEGVVEVVRPHGVEAEAALRRREHEPPVVVVRFRHDVHGSALRAALVARGLRQLGEDVEGARVEDRVDRVQPQAVDVELTHPVARVLDEVAPDAGAVRAVEVEGAPPWGLVAIREVRPELGKVVPLGPEMVVDDVEEDGEALRVAGVHEAAQPLRTAVGRLRRIEVNAVVTPVARARELGDRHELQRGDPQVGQPREMRDDGFEGARGRGGAHVELVEDEVHARAAPEALVRPRKACRIDHDRRSVHTLRLPVRHGIGSVALAVEAVLVARSGHEGRQRHLPQPLAHVA